MTKIKNFVCDKFNEEELKKVECEINEFTSTHDTIDIKISSCCNSFGWLVIYGVIYKE